VLELCRRLRPLAGLVARELAGGGTRLALPAGRNVGFRSGAESVERGSLVENLGVPNALQTARARLIAPAAASSGDRVTSTLPASTISVVMVSWRTGPVLDAALRAALSASDVDEVVLVNHGNPAAVEAKLDALAASEAKLTLVHTRANLGFARGCNIGAEAARGDRLFFLNPDTVLLDGAAARLAETGELQPTPWIVGARVVYPDGREQRGGRRGALTPVSALTSFTGLSRLPGVSRVAPDLHREGEPAPVVDVAMPVVSGAAMMIDRAGFDRLGGFDEGYFLHVEDIDICRRAAQAGGSVRFEPRATVVHHGSTSRVSLFRVETHKASGLVRYFWMHYPAWPARAVTVCAAPGIYAAVLARAALVKAAQRARNIVRRREALARLKRMKAGRAEADAQAETLRREA